VLCLPPLYVVLTCFVDEQDINQFNWHSSVYTDENIVLSSLLKCQVLSTKT
jgi:hypothetical protein